MYTRIVHPDIDHHSYSVVDIHSVCRLVSNRGDSSECSLNPERVMTISYVLLGLILLCKLMTSNSKEYNALFILNLAAQYFK